ncbi:nitrogen fixation/metabolism regulation signal transduction histidine kinase [Paucibacter oligotrophus]|uniref:histidine kinase n=1 Tax=Roseateles oligotrophus TaxID=1769250 RepID=A0A840LC88_9BURK|nr:ATP-binding protein [Roseateles oligotrophus]MBB4842937.1 nitrogen fixation/metabolism regulation signal transduction histidine kinase [Roseateles oligotrophus]
MSKAARWAWLVSMVAVMGVCGVLAFLLSISATSQRGFLERQSVWLFWVNAVVATVLLLVITAAAIRLLLRVRRGKFGSRLLLKLAGIFALVGVVPGLLIYGVSYQFVNQSIDSWFDVRLASALESGLTLGRGTLDDLRSDLAGKTRDAAERLAAGDAVVPQPLALDRLREQLGLRTVALVGGNGQILLSAGGDASLLTPDRPSDTMLRQARANKVMSEIEGLEDESTALQGRAQIRALALLPSADLRLGESSGGDRFLMVVRRIPTHVLRNALAVQAASSEYQQRNLERGGLRRMYLGTLTLALVLAVFTAFLLAMTLGNQLARPLLLLAEGVRQVAQGDLSRKPVLASRDELSGLTRSFADMTEQLSDARGMVERSVAQLESARTNLQTILDNLTAGVIVFDAQQNIDTVNPGATRILRLPLSAYRGRRLDEVPQLQAFAQAVWQRFEQSNPEVGERDHWQDAFELQLEAGQDVLTLLVRGAQLPHDARLMVFDDISEVVSAQRSAAWSEVARRLAHEIKNPLTPIQLSAERLQHKLETKLEGADQAMLVRSVATIVNQVQSMKQLVNEFRDYARLPSANLKDLDLNGLVAEVLSLYAEAQDAGHLHAELAPDLVQIKGDASQLRQVIHNLVQNALDAVQDHPDGQVVVRTQQAFTDSGEPRALRLLISDNGPGFAEKVLKRAFEPYVTTKSKGTGLGLAVVKKIADEHGARIRLANLHSGGDEAAAVIGAQVSLSFSKLATAAAEVGTAHKQE